MKRIYLIVVLIIVLLLLNVIYKNISLNLDFKKENNLNFYFHKDEQLEVIIFDYPIFINYSPNYPKSLKEQAEEKDYKFAVNFNYFKGNYLKATPAGLFQLNGTKLSEIVNDNQLTHVFVYDNQKNIIKFENVTNFISSSYSESKYSLIQTGPLIIENNKIDTDSIDSSLNGNGKFLRNIFGYTDDGNFFIIITRRTYNLETLSETVLGLNEFKDKVINAINLDGGPSTAIYSKEFPEYNFQDDYRLPLILGVK